MLFVSLRERQPSSDLTWRDPVFIERLLGNLSWSHLIELARLDPPLKRAFYEVQTLKEGWGVRELRRQIDSLLFERVGLSKDQDQVMAWTRSGVLPETPQGMIRDPYILEFTGLPVSGAWLEKDLEQALIDHLHDFLLELGSGFCFVGRQYRITIANQHHHLDLLFYHRHLRCLVAIDLKIGTFDHADAGQMNLYLNWLRENETRPDESPPVGIVLCAGKDDEELLYGCGLRNAEATILTCQDIDLSRRTLHVRHGKGGQDRLLPLMTTAAAAVKDYLAVRRMLLRGPDHGALFVTKRGKAFKEGNVYTVFRPLNAARGPEARHLYPHLLRHSIAVHLLRGKVDIRYIQEFLGHSDLDTTKHYLRLVPGHLKEDYDRAMPDIEVGAPAFP